MKYSIFLYHSQQEAHNNHKKGVKYMSITQSILVAIFCMAVVFTVLGLLWAIIRIFSLFIIMIEKRRGKEGNN